MEDYRETGPSGNGKTRKTGASNLAAVRETTRHVRIHANRVIFRGALNEVRPLSEPAVYLNFARLVVCQPRTGADVRRIHEMTVQQTIAVAVLVAQPSIVPFHHEIDVCVRQAPLCIAVRFAISAVEYA